MIPDFSHRVVCHLSYPEDGFIVNASIEPDSKRVAYITFVQMCTFVHALKDDARLWVVYMQDAYYRVSKGGYDGVVL